VSKLRSVICSLFHDMPETIFHRTRVGVTPSGYAQVSEWTSYRCRICGRAAQMKRPNYGPASHEEIIAGINIAKEIGLTIKALPNPAVRQMVKDLIALINVEPPK
jgi:hypothetical protein